MSFFNKIKLNEEGVSESETPLYVDERTTLSEKAIEVDVAKDALSTKVDYRVRQVIPDDATITKKAIVAYGNLSGVKKLIKIKSQTNGSLEIDNQYDNPELDIDIEYEYKEQYYSIKEKIKLDKSKSLQVNQTIQGKEVRTAEEYIAYLHDRINELTTDVNYLKSKVS